MQRGTIEVIIDLSIVEVREESLLCGGELEDPYYGDAQTKYRLYSTSNCGKAVHRVPSTSNGKVAACNFRTRGSTADPSTFRSRVSPIRVEGFVGSHETYGTPCETSPTHHDPSGTSSFSLKRQVCRAKLEPSQGGPREEC
jgi:hypothetical protein